MSRGVPEVRTGIPEGSRVPLIVLLHELRLPGALRPHSGSPSPAMAENKPRSSGSRAIPLPSHDAPGSANVTRS